MRSKQTSPVVDSSGDPLGPLGSGADGTGWERGSILTAPPFGYSPELPLRRPGGPKTRPANSACPLPDGIVSSLRRLKGLHQRLSICRVFLTLGCDSRLDAIEDLSLIAELADDGALIVIFIHPGGVDDAAAAEGVCTRLEQTLRHSGVPLGALRITVMPCDAAAIDESDATRDALMSLPSRPLLALAAAPAAVPA